MYDKEIFKKIFYGVFTQVTFSIGSMTGKKIFVGGKGFNYEFDEHDEDQMKMLANVLNAFYNKIEDNLKTSEEEQKLKDFHWFIKTLNNYRDMN